MCTIKGILKEINPLQTSTGGFTIQRIAVLQDGEHGTTIPIDFLGDKVNLLTNLKLEQPVNVSINMRGTIYNEKRYVSVSGWKIE